MKRFFTIVILGLAGLILGLAGLLVPVNAQTATSTFTPMPPPRVVFTPLQPSAQVTSLNAFIAAQNAQIAALQSQNGVLNAKLLASSPAATIAGQPFTNATGNLVFAHYQVSNFVGGQGVAARYAEIDEAAGIGFDGFALDQADVTSSNYLQNDADLFAAADQWNAAHAGKPTAAGVSHFTNFFTIDYANGSLEAPDNQVVIANLFSQYAARSSYWNIVPGRPVLSTYAGDGGGVQTVAAVYPPQLALIRAKGVNVFFLPGFNSPEETLAAGGEGVWGFPTGTTPLGDSSGIPGQEATAAAVATAKTPAGASLDYMTGAFVSGYWGVGHGLIDGNARFYNNFAGARAMDAQFDSICNVQHPKQVEVTTWNDFGEGSGVSNKAYTDYNKWGYFGGFNGPNGTFYYGQVPGYYLNQSGMQTDLTYEIQRYKTGARPFITQDRMVEYNRPQLAGVSLHPSADLEGGIAYAVNPSGDAPGLTDTVEVTVYPKLSCYVECSGVGPTVQKFVAGGTPAYLTFPVTQAGMPQVAMKRGGQVVLQVAGSPVAATGLYADVNSASVSSVPGVKFTLTVPAPAGFVFDHAALMCRSTDPSFYAMGVCNAALYDLSTTTPTLIAQNTLNLPAGISKDISQVAPPGMDALTQYDLGYGYGQIALAADPLNIALPPLAYPGSGNQNSLYDFAGKPLPSTHVRVQDRVVSTSTDPNKNGQGGCGFVVRSNVNAYYGVAAWAYVERYAGGFTLNIKIENNVSQDSNSAGTNVAASTAVNTLAPGEWYDISFVDDGTNLTATATPSNQQN